MPLSATDRIELHELAALYCDVVDAADWSRLSAVFDERATFDFRSLGLGVLEGVDAIRDQLIGFAGHTAAHLIANVRVEDGEPARMHSRVLTVLPDRRVGWGNYLDELVRTPSGWRIRHRVFTRGAPSVRQEIGEAPAVLAAEAASDGDRSRS